MSEDRQARPSARTAVRTQLLDATTAAPAFDSAGLILLAGLPYSGKTTVGAELATRGWAHLILDVTQRRSGLDLDTLAAVLHTHVLPQAFTTGKRLVLDHTNLHPRHRRALLALAAQHDVASLLVHLEADQQTRAARRAAFNPADMRLRPNWNTDTDFDAHIRRFSPPAPAEGALTLPSRDEHNPADLADQIERCLGLETARRAH